MVIDSLFRQTLQADLIILWLAESEFPRKEQDLPVELLEKKRHGLLIRWCEDLKPHKKYFFAIQLYPEDIIITVDDDACYDKEMVAELYQSYLAFPTAVSARRVHYMAFDSEEKIAPYEKWFSECTHLKGIPSSNLLPTGLGGILYPPGCMSPELFNKDNLMLYALYADDIWLKFVQLLQGTPVVWAETALSDKLIDEVVYDGLYANINAAGKNDQVINALLKIYGGQVRLKKEEDILRTFFPPPEIISPNNTTAIAIYGAKLGAVDFFTYLKKKSLPKPECFIVTQKEDNPAEIDGIPVRELAELPSPAKYLVIVALQEKYHAEISEALNSHGCTNAIFISNYQMKLLRFYLQSL